MGAFSVRKESESMREMLERTAQNKGVILKFSMNIRIFSRRASARPRNLFIPLFQNTSLPTEEFFSLLDAETKKTLAEFAKKEFHGEEGEVKSLWRSGAMPERIVLFGLGEKEKWNERKTPLIPRRMVQYAKREKISEFTTPLLILKSHFNMREYARLFAENAIMAGFEYNAYKKPPEEGWPQVKSISLAVRDKDARDAEAGIKEGVIIGEEVNRCRTLANTPGSDMTPKVLADEARKVGREIRIKVKILDEPEIKRLGMGGVLGVARGSDEKPKFIILEYHAGPKSPAPSGRGSPSNAGRQKPLVLVGKGVTFDTGGLNLKPDQHIYEMHMDMSGGAAVIHGIAAIARLKLPINVVGLIPAVENMPSGSSYRPGDLLKSMSGKVIEVLNTDAEGRVILSDALTYALRYKPGLIVDFATLTGAAHVALGSYMSAVFTNREELIESLVAVGKQSGDYVWPLPLWDEYLADIKGTFGDLANIGQKDRYGGAIHGAKFLEQFVENAPWAHVDIAPRMTAHDQEFLAKGAAGTGVRYIVELAKEYQELVSRL